MPKFRITQSTTGRYYVTRLTFNRSERKFRWRRCSDAFVLKSLAISFMAYLQSQPQSL